MTRSARLIVFLAFSCLLVLSCRPENKIPEDFDYGSVQGNTYHNGFFNMDLTFDTAWAVQSKEEMHNLTKKGIDIMAGSNEDLKKQIKASEVSSAELFGMFKYKLGTPVTFNPSLITMAENIAAMPGMKRGKDYLVIMKKNLEQTKMNYDLTKPSYTASVGNKSFDVQEAKLSYMGLDITQEYWVTVLNGFALSIIVSYNNDADRDELHNVVNHIKI